MLRFPLILSLLSLTVPGFSADPPRPEAETFPPAQLEFFEKQIRPVLAENCLDCHTGVKAKVGLQLQSRRGWLKGSDYREVIDFANPENSVLIKAIRQTGEKNIPSMPKDGAKLPEETVADFVQWIAMGLPWPEEEVELPDDPTQHWSFQPVAPPDVPADAGHPVDYFIREAQEKAGVTPAPKADRATLYRRAHFDLLGLPPKFDEQQKFVNDPRPDDVAWSDLIHHLMGSPHYGERWARHWMDVARYSDTRGYEAGGRERRFVYSYTYRDWLIKAFNEDIPYDQFVLYQLAAEQLVDWKGPGKHHLAAMGFISLGKNGPQELVVDDRVDTTFRGLMALTVSCARCHDHKFDPISTKEYYGIYSVFQNSLDNETPTIGEPKEGPEYEAYLKELAEKQKVIDDFLEPKLAKIAKEFPDIANRRIQLIAKLERADRRELQNKERVVDKFIADSKMEPDKALVVRDAENLRTQRVFVRGAPGRPGDIAPRQFLSLGGKLEPVALENGSGRLEMAREIVDPKNPLTARNIVNRVWMWHFGEGIVRTIDDFGIVGEKPDHPELLDWLANWFVENGSSFKKLHHLILTSETWQQDSANAATEANMLVDAENRLLWKQNRKRLELEQMRDAILDVSGNLSNEMYGRTVKILEPPYSNRRSVYAYIDRQNLNPVFRNFDFSNPQETTAKRPTTTIPMQALFTLNSEFLLRQSQLLAKEAAAAGDGIAHLHRRVFAAEPSENDRLLGESFLSSFESELASMPPKQTSTEWTYGWASLDEDNRVDFRPFEHWTGSRWQVAKEHPLKDNPLSYLYADNGLTHPGYTAKESAAYQWRSPEDLTVRIDGLLDRAAVGKGNGVRVLILTEGSGIVFDQVLDPAKRHLKTTVPEIRVAKNELIHFLVDPHENNSSHDSVRWSPQITDITGEWPPWDLAESFSGPAIPVTAWSAYAHALLNTNRFLFLN